jgi:DNA-binding LacI/PurR family transcriptional regulator
MSSRTITRELGELIRSGGASVGSYLPSTRALALQYGVSLNTVHAAMKELEGLKLVECRPRRGAMVLGKGDGGTSAASKQVGILLISRQDMAREYDWRMEWSWKIIHTLEEALFEAGLSSLLLPLQEGEAGLGERLDQLGDSLAGVMVLGRTAERPFIEALEQRDIPWVSINRPRGEGASNYNYVSADNQEAGRRMGRLFARLGWERVLVMGINPQAPGSDVEKVTGLFQGYLESGRSTAGIRVVDCEDVSQLVGYRTIRRLLEEGNDRPQGIFTTGDMLALGAIHALRDEGIRVPAEVGVVGSTGLSRSAQFDPPLTVVEQPMEAMGRAAAEMLLQMIREGVRKFAPRRIPCPLILRESVTISAEIRREWEQAAPAPSLAEAGESGAGSAGEATGGSWNSADEGVGGTLEGRRRHRLVGQSN